MFITREHINELLSRFKLNKLRKNISDKRMVFLVVLSVIYFPQENYLCSLFSVWNADVEERKSFKNCSKRGNFSLYFFMILIIINNVMR